MTFSLVCCDVDLEETEVTEESVSFSETENIETFTESETEKEKETETEKETYTTYSEGNSVTDYKNKTIPEYNGKDFVYINGGIPYFSSSEITVSAYEQYSPLDNLGRCGVAKACLSKELMPTEKRQRLQIKPSGWKQAQYDCVSGKSLYNRSHLIGYQLTAENNNERNLITGTQHFNQEVMVKYENMVADYIKSTGNHVMYRVTPMFKDNELVARGVEMEAYSVEDEGDSISYNVFLFNVQPHIVIDYKTGASSLEKGYKVSSNTSSNSKSSVKKSQNSSVKKNTQKANNADTKDAKYILNTNTKKFHLPTCGSVKTIKEENYQKSNDSRDNLISEGYKPCKRCNP